MTIRPKDRKLAELILFISERSEGDPPLGADKLARLLFNADFSAFRFHQKSITGQAYEKCYACPAPKRLATVRQALITRGELAIREREPYRQYRSFALRLADHSKFTADELALVTSLITANWGRSSWDVKNISEEICGWVARGELAVRQREPVNYKQGRTFALRSANLANFTAEEIALVMKIINQSWEYDAGFKGYFSNDSAHWEEDVPDYETIPYEFALLSKRPPTENDRRHCEQLGPLAAAVLSGQHKVFLYDEKTLFDTGVRQPARRSRTARTSNHAGTSGPGGKIAKKRRVRQPTGQRSSALVRRDT